MTKWIHNVSQEIKEYQARPIAVDAYFEIKESLEVLYKSDIDLINDILSGDVKMSKDGVSDIDDANEALDFLKGLISDVNVVSATEPAPFAKPDYRTKLNATDSIVTIAPDSIVPVDFLMTEERYVSGGDLLIEGAKIGDYVTAEVYDKDGVIPAPYQAALCEAHPSVAKYIEKAWIMVEDGSFTKHTINTYPLNAKITPGLYLRVTYHSTAEAGDRKVGITYHLTKKL